MNRNNQTPSSLWWALLGGMLWLASLVATPARADEGPYFPEGELDAALAALEGESLLLVEVGADWCAPCNQLANEILDTPAAREVLGIDRGLRVDFEGDAGQNVKRRFGVLALPTLLVVNPAGYEVGRVEGYPGRTEWIDAVRDARAGRTGLYALTARANKDPKNLELAIELAQARLVRGEAEVALRSLDKIIARSDKDLAAAAHAARVKGRWLLRVREDGAAALAHFDAVRQRFAGTPHEAGFIYWTASAHEKLGQRVDALGLFDEWRMREPKSITPLELQAEFMVHYEYPLDITESRVRDLLAAKPDAASWYLFSRVLVRIGDRDGAHAAARKAIELEPGTALYGNHARRIGAL